MGRAEERDPPDSQVAAHGMRVLPVIMSLRGDSDLVRGSDQPCPFAVIARLLGRIYGYFRSSSPV